MNRFLTTVFGGLLAIFMGVGLAWSAGRAWRAIAPSWSNLASVGAIGHSATPGDSISDPNDSTTVSGFNRIIKYTASQEEDLINEAAQALPSGSDTKISAGAYLVKDLTTGVEYARFNEDKLLPIASLTKLVTAEVARRLIPPETEITLDRQAVAVYGNTAGFKVGETFTAGDLLYPLLLVSSNDAAQALADHYGQARFIQAMNAFTQSIGAYRTYFSDPSGLSPLNESTANDMAIIIDWIRAHDPGVIALTAQKSKVIRNHVWVNPTHFLSWSYYLGGKNGYTDEADRTAVSLFNVGQSKDIYVVVVLGSDNRDADVIKLLKKVK